MIVATFSWALEAEAGQAHVYLHSNPSGGGWVYVNSSNSAPSTYDKTEHDLEIGGFGSSGDKTFYLFYKAAPNYVFKGWSKENKDVNTGTTTQGWQVKQSATGFGEQRSDYYAIFARMTSSVSSITFDDTQVDAYSQKTFSITIAHASNVTAIITGANADQFSFQSGSVASSTTIKDNSIEETNESITIFFRPTSVGTKNATLTFNSTNGLNDVTVSLTGSATLIPNTLNISVNSSQMNPDETVSVNMTTNSNATLSANITNSTLSSTINNGTEVISYSNGVVTAINAGTARLVISQDATKKYSSSEKYIDFTVSKIDQNLTWTDTNLDLNLVKGTVTNCGVTSSSGLPVTLESNNTAAIIIDGQNLNAVDLGTATITASQPGNYKFNPAENITRIFSVGEKKQASFTPSWEGHDVDIKVGASATIGLQNIADDETFTISTGTNGVISWDRVGNTLTINALSVGTTTLTLQQQGSNILEGITAEFAITVSKYANEFAIAADAKAMKVEEEWTGVVIHTGNQNTQVSYSVPDVVNYDAANNKIVALAEGSTVITFTQEATATHEGTSKSINVTVTKVVNTLSVTLANTEVDVEGTISLVVSGRVSDGATHAYISDTQLSTEVNNGTDVITYANDVITACNAGTAKIRFTQDATAKYTAYESETYTITVNKISNVITVTLDDEQKNSKNVGHEVTVNMGLTSTSGSEDFLFTRISGTDDIATINATSIVSGQTDGTSIWEISQAETYKYAAATTSVRVKVNSVAEEEGYVYTGWTDGNEYSWSTISETAALPLNGPGETFTFQAKATAVLGFWNSTSFYAQYSTDGGKNWTNALTIQLSDKDKWYDFSCTVPENATHVRLLTQTGATGNKQVRNLKVTRRTFVHATASQANLGEVYTDKTASATFNVSYSSTNGGNIDIISYNPRFAVDKQTISVANHSDNVSAPTVVTVTYTPDPNHLGDDAGSITISDRYYSEELTFNAFAKKYETTITRGSNDATATTVDGTIDNAFAFTGASAATPSANSNDDFYYSIVHNLATGSVHNGDDVISYDPATNTITGLNAGTASLTISQKSTDTYSATNETFEFTVTKVANEATITLGSTTLDVDGTTSVSLSGKNSDGAVSVTYSNIAYTNESMNQEGGLLSYNAENETLTAVNAGTATVTVAQAETYKYLSKSQQFTVTVNKLAQTLTWDREVETALQVGAEIEGNTATSAEGLTPVTYASSNTAAIEVNASTGKLTAKAAGSNITITASQAGNYKYAPATITRQFSVFTKQTPTFIPDEDYYDSNTKTITMDMEGRTSITVTGVGVDAEAGFTISGYDSEIINVVTTPIENGYTITLTSRNIGETALTITQTASESFIAKSQTYTIIIYGEATLTAGFKMQYDATNKVKLLDDNANAYTAGWADDGTQLELAPLFDNNDAEKIIPNDLAVLLYSTTGGIPANALNYTLTKSQAKEKPANNAFIHTSSSIDAANDGDHIYYVLGAKNGEVSFYKFTGVIPAGKVVLVWNKTNGQQAPERIEIQMEDEIVTALLPIWADDNSQSMDRQYDGQIYTIMGMPVKDMTQPGLYILNGKKYIVR